MYLFLGIAHALRAIVVAKMLPEVEKVLQKLDEHGMRGPGPAKYKNGLGYYDDLALRAFWRGFTVAILRIWIRTLLSTRTKIAAYPSPRP